MSSTAAQVPVSLEPLYTEQQQQILYCLSIPGGFLSFVGSLFIAVAITRDSDTNNSSRTFQRILLGLSVTDFITSLADMGLYWPWSIPEEASSFIYNAHGTRGTCQLNGFVATWGTATQIYSASLALYYIMRVRWQWTEEFIAKRIEPWLHGFALLWTGGAAIVAVILDSFNPLQVTPGTCWFSEFPPNCDEIPDVECIRDTNGVSFLLVLLVGVVTPLLCLLGIIVCMILLYRHVRATECRLLQYTFNDMDMELSQKAAKTGIFYVLAFLAARLPSMVLVGARIGMEETLDNANTFFVFAVMFMALSPLQGFYNALIYFRERRAVFESSQGSLHCLWPVFKYMTFCCCFVAPSTSSSRASTTRSMSKTPTAEPVGTTVELSADTNFFRENIGEEGKSDEAT